MKYIYGPVQSRRMGLSLGISLTPHKVCQLDCVYCQVGATTLKTAKRMVYADTREVLSELQSWFEVNPDMAGKLAYVTLAGAGEPTLHTDIASLIAKIKSMTKVQIAVITNSCCLPDPAVRAEILGADLIVPSLDAVTQEVFAKINRPVPGIKIEDIIEGLVNLRKEYRGKIWLEIMLVRGINDDIRQIRKFKDIVDRINPDLIQLNSPVRSTTQKDVHPAERVKLEQVQEILGEKAQIV